MGAKNSTPQYPRPRLAEMIAGELRERILSGVFSDGDTLPKQEDLIEEFGVSLPSIREALRVLETEGLVTVRRGNVGGALVHTPQSDKAAYMLGLVLQSRSVIIRDVAEALSRLDPACAAKCAERADRSTTIVPLLLDNVEACKAALDDPAVYANLAREFHEHIIDNCGNDTMILVVGTLESLWRAHIRLLSGQRRPGSDAPPTPSRASREQSLTEHIELVERISSGDPEGVTVLAHRHLTERDDLAYPFSLDSVVMADALKNRGDR